MNYPEMDFVFTPKARIQDNGQWQAVVIISASVIWGGYRTVIGSVDSEYPELFGTSDEAYEFAKTAADGLRGDMLGVDQ